VKIDDFTETDKRNSLYQFLSHPEIYEKLQKFSKFSSPTPKFMLNSLELANSKKNNNGNDIIKKSTYSIDFNGPIQKRLSKSQSMYTLKNK
jgi:hypothetical protein